MLEKKTEKDEAAITPEVIPINIISITKNIPAIYFIQDVSILQSFVQLYYAFSAGYQSLSPLSAAMFPA